MSGLCHNMLLAEKCSSPQKWINALPASLQMDEVNTILERDHDALSLVVLVKEAVWGCSWPEALAVVPCKTCGVPHAIMAAMIGSLDVCLDADKDDESPWATVIHDGRTTHVVKHATHTHAES